MSLSRVGLVELNLKVRRTAWACEVLRQGPIDGLGEFVGLTIEVGRLDMRLLSPAESNSSPYGKIVHPNYIILLTSNDQGLIALGRHRER